MTDSDHAAGAGSLPPVQKLEGFSNYDDWRTGMMFYLRDIGVWYSIKGYPNGDTTNEDVKAKHCQRALNKIGLMIKPCCYAHVKNAMTAKEAWDNLALAYDDTGLNKRVKLLSDFGSLKLENFSSMTAYVQAFVDIQDKLRSMNKPLDEDFVGAMMLAGLPARFEPMRQTYSNCGVDITSALIGKKLVEHEASEKASCSRDNAAFHAKQFKGTPSRPYKSYGKQQRSCFECGSTSHLIYDCPKKRGQGQRAPPSHDDNRNRRGNPSQDDNRHRKGPSSQDDSRKSK